MKKDVEDIDQQRTEREYRRRLLICRAIDATGYDGRLIDRENGWTIPL